MSDLISAVRENRASILQEWLQAVRAGSRKRSLIDQDLESQASEALTIIANAPDGTALADAEGAVWQPLKELLASFSVSAASLGFSPSEVSLFILSLKTPLFRIVRRLKGDSADELFAEITTVDNFVDRLALHTSDSYIEGRNEVIARQQQEMLELSTPVVTLWEGIVALPLIGTLDSNRTQVVMESLLQKIVETGSDMAIIDITGVPTVDTLVAQHLLKTVTALRLMGAECIISGIRPQIAQTIVHLGVDLQGVVTKASLADALALALKRGGYTVTR